MLADDPLRPEVDPYAPPVAELGRPSTDVDRADLAEAEAIRRHHLNHESSVRGLGGLNYLGAAACLIGGVAMVVLAFAPRVGNQPIQRGAVVGTAAVLLLLGVLYAFIGRGLRGFRPWGRWLTVSLIGLAFVSNFVQIFLLTPGDIAPKIGGLIAASLIPGYILFLMLSKKGQVVFSPGYKSVIARTPHVKMKTSIIVKILGGLLLLVLGIILIGVIIQALTSK